MAAPSSAAPALQPAATPGVADRPPRRAARRPASTGVSGSSGRGAAVPSRRAASASGPRRPRRAPAATSSPSRCSTSSGSPGLDQADDRRAVDRAVDAQAADRAASAVPIERAGHGGPAELLEHDRGLGPARARRRRRPPGSGGANTPIAAELAPQRRGRPHRACSAAARRASGSPRRRGSGAARRWSDGWSSVGSKSTLSAPRAGRAALADDVALDLRGAGGDRQRQGVEALARRGRRPARPSGSPMARPARPSTRMARSPRRSRVSW